MRTITYRQVEFACKKLNYVFFKGEFNINLFGIRDANAEADDRFDCTIGIAYQEDGRNKIELFPATTIPGIFWLRKFFNEKWGGTAIMKEGQFRSSFVIGKQHGHEALIQCKPIPVYRDGNKDLVYDKNPAKIMTGIFSTNIHRAGKDSPIIGNWSAGCQVLKRSADMDRIIELCKKSSMLWGNTFTYTLFSDDQI